MAFHWFNPTVYIKGQQPGITEGISHVEGAAEALLTFTKQGPKWRMAMKACVSCLEGEATPQEVRRLFRLAVVEEGILRER
ncbi:DUF982 domain-containing protein [Mesorhizobium sp. M7A.F.Ca.CA.004.02.1.1]|uniref:DUF982 domain-containing protein n=1 Tax=Mesorhizobium sp. M7A.F.Ca.CA.004.02.1.1 TaxID=2496690 RepID=UPI000FCAE39E|nr:DUF982 domain-containing protein [Mesorhizobium sp. M7A.F.Ca.CA.004.02.1.1]RVB05678.1 DUF982 domain-containing protein [Mesorhizobium sp. M7A.F.Ca.CA.004.02.1.1]